MKINFKTVVVSLATILGVSSCSDFDEISSNNVSKNDGTPVPSTFTTTFEEMEPASSLTRTTEAWQGLPVLWATGDQISVFDGPLSNRKFTLQSGAGTANGKFTGLSISTMNYYAIYPYSSVYSLDSDDGVVTGVSITSGFQGPACKDNEHPMKVMMGKATSDDGVIQFKNITSRIDLTINNLKDNTSKLNVVFSANGGEVIAATELEVSWNNGDPKINKFGGNCYPYIKVNEPRLSSDKKTSYVTIYMAPQKLMSGYTICVEDYIGENTTPEKIYFHSNTASEYKRNKVYPMVINCDKANGIGSVDLGLPSGILIATMNVGSSNPLEAGGYYAFGEKTTKAADAYTWATYDWSQGTTGTDAAPKLTKYVTYVQRQSSPDQSFDGKSILDSEDDIASITTNGSMHIPTRIEAEEIIQNTIWEKVKVGKVNVIKVISKKNGKFVYLTMTGASKTAVGSVTCLYPTSQTNNHSYAGAGSVFPYRDIFGIGNTGTSMNVEFINNRPRCYGYNVRGVTSKDKHAYVDMGEAGKWATCNIGANNPEGFGYYYAFGETTTKQEYTIANYKYNGQVLGMSDETDAATANWGSNWRTPSEDDFNKLFNACTWTKRLEADGLVEGWFGVHKTNGNTIFFPSAGYWDTEFHPYYNTSTGGHGSEGRYLVNNVMSSNAAKVFSCTPNATVATKPSLTSTPYGVYLGCSVRPIRR